MSLSESLTRLPESDSLAIERRNTMTKTQRTLLLSIYNDPYINTITTVVFTKYSHLAMMLESHTDRNIQAIEKHRGLLQLADFIRFQEDNENWKSIFKSVSAVYKDMTRTYDLKHPV